MQISGLSITAANQLGKPTVSTPKAEDFTKILDDFVKEAFKTPEERAKDAILKEHGLTEDSYNRLPKEQRDAIGREIAEAVQRVERQRTGTAGNGKGVTPNTSGIDFSGGAGGRVECRGVNARHVMGSFRPSTDAGDNWQLGFPVEIDKSR